MFNLGIKLFEEEKNSASFTLFVLNFCYQATEVKHVLTQEGAVLGGEAGTVRPTRRHAGVVLEGDHSEQGQD